MNALTKGKQLYFVIAVTAFLSGCGTVYVNPSDRNAVAAARESIAVAGSVDSVYRALYGHLQDCVSLYGYRVRGEINRERTVAGVTVDSGLGFDRTLYLADALLFEAELERVAAGKTRVTFVLPSKDARPFAEAAKRRLQGAGGSCRV